MFVALEIIIYTLKWPSLIVKNKNKSLFYKEKSLVGLTPGKNLDTIENWRPIILTNWDLKIFTIFTSDRVSRLLDKIIAPAHTARFYF